MPTISSWITRVLVAPLTLVMVLGSVASAQAPLRIRGLIGAFDGSKLTIRSSDGGTNLEVRVSDSVPIFGVVKRELSDIKEGSYIGVFGLPEPDGTQKALAVRIYPESERGVAEGYRIWDLRNNSTMTSATVAETVKGANGQNILVKYKNSEKRIAVPTGTPIVTFVEGDKSELKPGANVTVYGLMKREDGIMEASRVDVGRDGITPPM